MPKATISRCGGGGGGGYADTVLAMGGRGNLRLYWRLGETFGLFADTSGFNPGDPADGAISGPGANTRGVTGCLGPTNDDGAWQITAQGPPVGTNEVHVVPHAGENPTGALSSAVTVVVWFRAQAVGPAHPDYRGALLNVSSIVAGAPSYEFGWGLELFYVAGATTPTLRFFRSNSAGSGGAVIVELPGIVLDTDYMAHGTFDGAQVEVGVNGASFVSAPDTLRGITGTAAPQAGEGVEGVATAVIDEVAVWSAVLAHSDLAYLYSVGVV